MIFGALHIYFNESTDKSIELGKSYVYGMKDSNNVCVVVTKKHNRDKYNVTKYTLISWKNNKLLGSSNCGTDLSQYLSN